MAHLSVKEENSQSKPKATEPTNSDLVSALNEMTKALKGTITNKTSSNKNYYSEKNRKTPPPRGSRGKPQCYYCKKIGHFQWQCRKKAFNDAQKNKPVKRASNVRNADPRGNPSKIPVAAIEESDSDPDIIAATIKNDKNLVLVQAWVSGHKTKALIDCGSGITIISETLAEKTKLPIVDYEGPKVKVANGRYFHALGEIDIKVTLMHGQERVVAPVKAMVVKSLAYDLLLGNDYLGPCGILVDCANQSISFKPRVWKVESVYGYIHSKDTVKIPPRSSLVINVIASEKNKLKKQNYVLYTDIDSYAKHRVCFPNTIVNFLNGHCSIEVTNFGRVQQNVMRGDILGCFEPVDGKCIFNANTEFDFENYGSEDRTDSEDLEIPAKESVSSVTDVSSTKELAIGEGTVKIGKNLNEEQVSKLKSLLDTYKDRFAFKATQIGQCNKFYHRIDTQGLGPISVQPYRMSFAKREQCRKLVQEMIDLGVIKPSCSPWSAPVVIVPKRDGGLRFCVDFRKLNAITKRDVYPLPRIQDALDALGNSRFFTTLDLSSGYWQLKVAPEDQEKTSFVTIDGTYEFNVMPFGLTNAPATFQRAMDVVLAGLKWNSCLVYLDDIIVFAPDFDTHLARIEAILIRITEANFTLKPDKCVFAVNTIKYLGYIVGPEGQSPDPALVEAIVNFPKPKTIKDIRSFIGMCSVFRKFVEGFSRIAEPLIRLTKKGYTNENKIHWDAEQDLAFIKLKEKLASAPVLAHYDPKLPI
jgi:hypothetical protein